jgi:DNA repair photolyase
MGAQVLTKSDLVCRDADILGEMTSMVSITITTVREDLSRKLEPGAPPPEKRLEALRILHVRGVPISARIDPIIPGINDCEIENLVFLACEAGVSHITSSTYKARPDNWRRIRSAFPLQSDGLEAMFKMGCSTGGSSYLPGKIRENLMLKVERAALKNGVTFASCREGRPLQAGVLCDGSHLMGRKI